MLLIKKPQLWIFCCALSLMACAKFNDSKFGKLYHNVTAKYNAYFNAREQIKITRKNVEDNHIEDFTKILDVERWGNETTGKTNASDMDKCIEKCKKVIQKHPESNWVDDSYLEIGKAYFFKFENYEALDIFKFLANEYKDTEVGKESMLWIVMSYSQMTKYEEALAHLATINADKDFPKELKYLVELVNAHIKVKMGNYSDAIRSIEKALPSVHNKQHYWRYKFILAQMYQHGNELRKAKMLYESIKNKNMPYQFLFESRINLTKCMDMGLKSNALAAIKSFKKLLKDDNNIEYFDKIYYEIAQIHLLINQKDLAIKNFEVSSFLGGNKNPMQKTNTFLALGDIYFKDKAYTTAGLYYDSCAAIIPENHAKYEEIKAQQTILSQLINNLNTITLQDSLQRLAGLSTEQLSKKIDEVIKNEEAQKAEAEKKASMQELRSKLQQENAESTLSPGFVSNAQAAGDWYFYNAAALGSGITEFKRKWGNRKLEDNWRRSDKMVAFTENKIDTNELETSDTQEIDTNEMAYEIPEQLKDVSEDKKQYYNQIPFLPVQKKASDDQIIEALFGNGEIYYEKLNSHSMALKSFEKLQNRFPKNKYELPTAYYLYKLGVETKDSSLANANKNYILKEHPTSDYAKILRGDKFKEGTRNKALENTYMQAYHHYMNNNCDSVMILYTEAEKSVEENYLKPNFELFRIMCQFKDADKKTLIEELKVLADNYADMDAGKNAKNIIRYLEMQIKEEIKKELKPEIMDADTIPEKKEYIYTYSDVGPFIFILLAPKIDTKKEKIQVALSDYNTEYFKLKKLNVRSFIFNDQNQLYMVTRFSNINEIMKYYTGISTDNSFGNGVFEANLKMFFATEANFRLLVKEKDEAEYLEFFKEYYLKKEN